MVFTSNVKPEEQRIDPSEDGRGPFDEDDIELQLSSSTTLKGSRGERVLRVLRFSFVLFLGLVLIGASVRIGDMFYGSR